jgi:hypothetical protein
MSGISFGCLYSKETQFARGKEHFCVEVIAGR